MKNRGLSLMTRLIVAIIVVTMLFMIGCGGDTTSEEKILKIGICANYGWSAGLDLVTMAELQAEIENANGGLDIGGDKYTIEIIAYDNEGDQTVGEAAINRLIYEDDVKFILSEYSGFIPAWATITEANKVIYCVNFPGPTIHSPDFHYTFNTMGANFGGLSATAWFANNFPDIESFVFAGPDTARAHDSLEQAKEMAEDLGIKNVQLIYYPADATDLSAMGTQVKNLNPDVFAAKGGGPALDALAIKAVWAAGWTGIQFASNPTSTGSLLQILPAEALEGLVLPALPGEFDEPLTQIAKEFKDAFIDKYGEYEGELIGSGQMECLLAALQEAGSIDTDEVAAVISDGLKYEGASGTYQMVARVDQGNDRTTDSIYVQYMKVIEGGKSVYIGSADLDQGLELFEMYYGSE